MESSAFHDAKLIGVMYEPNKIIRLSFETVDGLKRVVLRGVHRFVAHNLADGNIVLDVLSTTFGNLKTEEAVRIAKNAFEEEFESSNMPERGEPAELWLNQIKKGNLHVLVVEPSYGAEVIAVCSNVELL